MRKMKALTVKMETVTVVGRGRQNQRRFVYFVYTVSSKIFFLADISGGSSFIRVILHSGK